MPTRQVISLGLFAVSVGWLAIQAPGAILRELWFVGVMLGLTLATRTVTYRESLLGVSLGIGLAAPLMLLVGWGLAAAGLDASESELASWAVVPVLEEGIKLVPVCLIAVMHSRRTRRTLNPSDWVLLGCVVGAGFAMVENAQLVRHDPGVLRDMAPQYGPTLLVPGAWGFTGFVGHAAATGMAAGGIGLWLALRRMARVGAGSSTFASVALVAPAAWVTLEHALANLRVNTGSDLALWLGNGRLTPWLFLGVTALVLTLDGQRAVRAVARSRTFRVRLAMLRAAFGSGRPARQVPWQARVAAALREVRLINAAAWTMLEPLMTNATRRQEAA